MATHSPVHFSFETERRSRVLHFMFYVLFAVSFFVLVNAVIFYMFGEITNFLENEFRTVAVRTSFLH